MPFVISFQVSSTLGEKSSLNYRFRAYRVSTILISWIISLATFVCRSLAVTTREACLCASTSRAQAGPCSLALHMDSSSCLGMVSTKGMALQASLSGPTSVLLRGMSDICQLLQDSPECTYILCMPILPPTASVGVRGSLLLGFSCFPNFTPKRSAGMAVLCSMLSVALAHSSPPVICNVETMMGRHFGCACCAPDSDDDLDLDFENEEPCHSDDSLDRRGPPPNQSLLVPISEEEEHCQGHAEHKHKDFDAVRSSEDSISYWNDYPQKTIQPPAASTSTLTPSSGGSPGFSFRKDVVALVTRDSLRQRHSLRLTFANRELENEFTRWYQHRLKPVDALFGMLLLASMLLLAVCRPIIAHAAHSLPTASPLLAAPLLLPFIMAKINQGWHERWRETLVSIVRLYLVVLAGWITAQRIGTHDHEISSDVMIQGSVFACWAAAGGETLITPALGLQLRMARHVPLQLAALALMVFNISLLCGDLSSLGTTLGAFGAAGAFGFLMPTLVLRKAELTARNTFEGQISAAAGLAC